MVGNRLRTFIGIVAAGLVVASAPAGAQLAATAAVQVTNDPAPLRSHSSPQIAVNPKNGDLVAVESDVRGSSTCAIHISTDGGRSWFAGGDPMVKPFTDCGFYAEYGPLATEAFSKDGTLYVAFVASDFLNRARNDTPRHVYLARSVDSGRTFTTTRVYEAPDGNPDRGLNKGPMLAIDPTNPQLVYVGWRQGVNSADAKEKLKANVAASSDGGRTFGPPVDLTDPRGADFPAIAVDKAGTVHAIFWVRAVPGPTPTPVPVRPIVYRQSTDHGKTWSAPVDVDPGNVSAGHPPLLAADPKTSDVYMVWNANAEVQNTVPGYNGDLDAFIRVSHDGGKTWGDRVTISDETVKANQFEPGIAIAPDGRVDVAWYDFRNSPTVPLVTSGHSGDTGISDVYFTSSTDHGATFALPVRVNDRGIDRSKGVWSNNIDSKFNVGVAATDNDVFFAWQDTRNAIGETGSEDVYMSSLPLHGTEAVITKSGGIPGWTLAFTGLFGLGLGVVAAGYLMRRRDPAPQSAPRGTPARA
jgi:hypothetical protein